MILPSLFLVLVSPKEMDVKTNVSNVQVSTKKKTEKHYVSIKLGTVRTTLNIWQRPGSILLYGKDHIGKRRYHSAKRRAAELNRTPVWADDWKIEQFYKEARKLTRLHGIQFHVDHIIPLQGRLVSGLHVQNNLQIITASENYSKNNTFIPG